MALWLQVRELAAVRRELDERGVRILREPRREPWGLLEMWIADPDGVRICVVEVPEEHPLPGRQPMFAPLPARGGVWVRQLPGDSQVAGRATSLASAPRVLKKPGPPRAMPSLAGFPADRGRRT
jgi:Glyoxalase/Bleomycin resistance protein/Dioxygenase superfamily